MQFPFTKCEYRFLSQKDIINCTDGILIMMESDSIICQAAGLKKILTSYDFGFGVYSFSKITSLVDILFSLLQKSDIELSKTQLQIFETILTTTIV